MAIYTPEQMNAGVLGEVLTAGTTYAFTFTTDTYASQSVFFGSAQVVMNSATTTNASLQGSSTNQIVGSLNVGQQIPLSNSPISCDINQTATIFVNGLTRGSGAQLSFTSTGWNGVNGSGTGKITEAFVVTTSGSNYISGDDLNVPRGTPGIQGLGFTNADKAAIMDIFPDKIKGTYISSNFDGVIANFDRAVSQSNFVSSSTGIAFNMTQVPKAIDGNQLGAFGFTPTATIPVNSYLIKSTGHFTMRITG